MQRRQSRRKESITRGTKFCLFLTTGSQSEETVEASHKEGQKREKSDGKKHWNVTIHTITTVKKSENNAQLWKEKRGETKQR